MALRIRFPGWALRMKVSVSGQPVEHAAKPGSYVTIQRAWQDEIGRAHV